ELGGGEKILAELRSFLEQSRQSWVALPRRGREQVSMLASSRVEPELPDPLDVQRREPLQIRHQLVEAVGRRKGDLMRERNVHADRHQQLFAHRRDLVVELGERLSTARWDDRVLDVL